MAALQPLAQSLEDPFRNGEHVSITRVVRSSAASDTLLLPEGIGAAAHVTSVPVDSGDAALTVSSISQAAHPGGVTVTFAAGVTGATYLVIAVHIGNAAGL